MIDLHVHTTCSDGRETPEEIVRRAISLGLEALAITDHDTVAGLPRARETVCGKLALIGGVEVSAVEGSTPIHILGYGIDPTSRVLRDALRGFQHERTIRAREMVNRLNRMGVDVTMEMIEQEAKAAPITRAHIARALFKGRFVHTYDEAFIRYLGEYAPAFIPQGHLSATGAIELAHRSGGVAVMAHPGLTRRDELIAGMVRAGLDGIEIVHPFHTPTMTGFYSRLAHKYSLLATGGSDTHGTERGGSNLGNIGVPSSVLPELERAIAERRAVYARDPLAKRPPSVS